MSDVQKLPDTARTFIDAEPGLFFEISGLGVAAHAVFFAEHKGPSVFGIGPQINVNGMFAVYWLTKGETRVGLLFTSTFQVINAGGYLVAFMNQARGRASQVDVLFKSDDLGLVIYNFPNRGTMVVLTKIGDEVLTIFEEQ